MRGSMDEGVKALRAQFERLKSRWGRTQPERIKPVDAADLDTWRMQKRLLGTEPIDISDEIAEWLTTNEKGFIRYGLPYIIFPYRVGSSSKPKYHLTECSSLLRQIEKEKHVAHRFKAIHTSVMEFDVEIWKRPGEKKQKFLEAGRHSFSPCKDCLTDLKIIPAPRPWNRAERERKAGAFSLRRHFNLPFQEEIIAERIEPSSGEARIPDATDGSYNVGSQYFFRAIKRVNGFKCSECGLSLSAKKDQQYLTIHHKDRKKRNDVLANLEVLCIRCHAKQPRHEKLKLSPEYAAFIAAFSG